MSRLDLSRSSKGLMQRMEAMIRATLPRQARVTRTEGNSVWVRFLGDTAGSPEAKFPSTVAGVPVATMGWVITLGGKKGLFVATGIAMPFRNTHRVNTSTTPRTYPGTAAPAGAAIQPNQHVALLTGGGNFIHTDGVPWVQVYHANRGVVWVNNAHLTAL